MTSTIDLQYPIGKQKDQRFAEKLDYDEEAKAYYLTEIRLLPQLLEFAVQNLDEQQLHTPYREGGWTVQQVIHHVADSHMNAYIRFKLALTELNPTIKPYNQDAWVHLGDTMNVPVNISLTLLHALHARLYELLKGLNEADFSRTVYHPEQAKELSVWRLLAMYAWHGKHHTAHVTALRERRGW